MSFMNGLSALGAGVAQFAGQAGLEAQKAQLAQQQTILADQLATTRESAGRVQAGQIAATAATQAQAATAANTATEQAGASARNQATIAGTAANTAAEQAGATARNLATINAPPDVIKVLRALHVIPDDSASGQSAGAPSSTGSGAASPSGGSGGFGASAAPTPAASSSPMDNPLVRKALGYPQEGSDEAIRYAIAQDVKNDPNFKYKPAGVQAAEIETRVTAASGKMMDPVTRDAMATAIASYQQPPITGRGLTAPGAGDIMAAVQAKNPDYQASRYNQVNKAMTAFGTGSQGDKVRFLDTGVQHLNVLDQAADALNNNDPKAFNALGNVINRQFGVAAPNTFDGLKQIVATEVEKSIAGGIGSSADREHLMDSLNSANSPQQLKDMLNGYRSLMAGQLSGLQQQYEQSTGFKTGPFAFETKLTPETLAVLKPGGQAASSKTTAPIAAIPAWVKPGDQYSPSRGMARGADGAIYGAPQ